MSLDSNKNLIKSVLFLIFGSLIFAYPDKVISIAATVFGGILVLYGLFMVVKNYYETKQNSENPSTLLTIGIVLIIAGIAIMILSNSISLIIQYLIGAWILFNGIEKLILSLSLPKNSRNFISQLIISILLLAAGLYTVLVSNITVQVVGLIMIIYAVLEIIGFFTNKTIKPINKEQENKEVITKLDVKDKKKKATVKEAKVVEEKSAKKNK